MSIETPNGAVDATPTLPHAASLLPGPPRPSLASNGGGCDEGP